MIELTHSDAMTYCLSVAQIIPVFLIALSVLDNGRVTRRIERTKKESVKLRNVHVNGSHLGRRKGKSLSGLWRK
jgi:hypothetical protein